MNLFTNDTLPTVVVISNIEIHPIFFRHKLLDRYHVHHIPAYDIKVDDLLKMRIDILVISDEDFGENVISLCKQIKQLRDFQFTPLLLITGNLKRSYQDKLKKAGVLDILHEPLEEDELFSKINGAEKFNQAHKKVDTYAKTAPKTPPNLFLKKRTFLNKTDILRIQTTISEKKPLSLAMIEVDQYREALQKWGPAVMEEMEERVYATLHNKLRSHDVIIPISEGKYVVVFSNLEKRKAKATVQHITREIAKEKVVCKKGSYSPTLLVGMVCQDPSSDILFSSLEEMMRTARKCLSQAKADGDQLVLYMTNA